MEVLGVFQDDVDVQDTTTPIDDTHATNRVRERKLLHWVNSLPLTKCLLVEDLRDLRFGDVLHEIVEWLQCSAVTGSNTASEVDEFATDTMIERLRRVVQFAARECRSQDTDAMYVVNDAKCVERVVAGQYDSICAVLTVLRRLSVQHLRTLQEAKYYRRALHNRCAQEEVIKGSLQQIHPVDEVPKEAMEPKHKPKRSGPSQTTARKSRNAVKQSVTARKSPSTLPVQSRAPKQGSTRRSGSAAGTRKKIDGGETSRANSTVKPMTDKTVSHQPNIYHDSGGLHVFGMVDPSAKPPPKDVAASLTGENGSSSENALAIRFCNWAQHILQVQLPLEQIFVRSRGDLVLRSQQKIRQAFANGVLLCQIGAAITSHYGVRLNQSFPASEELQSNELVRVTNLHTRSESHRNMEIALTAFKRCGLSSVAIASIEGLQRPGINFSFKGMWKALNEVIQRLEQLPHVTVTPSAQTDSKTIERGHVKRTPHNTETRSADIISSKHITSPLSRKSVPTCSKRPKTPLSRRKDPEEDSLSSCAPLKRNRPYITNEQIHVVDEWLARLGHDVKKASISGVLHDPMRNGVLFCLLLLLVPSIMPFSYCKFPQTLTDMRENISKAFERLEKLRIPTCYLTPTAGQAVLMGERQINYGILWHVWQVSQEQKCSTSSISFNGIGDGLKITNEDLKGVHKHLAIDTTPLSSTEIRPSPLLFDVPAIALTGQEKPPSKNDQGTFVHVRLDESFTQHLAWGENHASSNDDDDVFPVPKAPSSSPIRSEEILPTPRKTLTDLFDAGPYGTVKSPDQSMSNDLYARANESEVISAFSQDAATRVASLVTSESSDIAVDTTMQRAELAECVKQCIEDVPISPSSCKPNAVRGEIAPMVTRESVDDIVTWLKRLDIHIKDTAAFHDPSAKLVEFQSGVLLCCIVEKVEYMRSIPGITRPSSKQQLSKASALHNIAKALDMLKQKKTMPLHLLRRAPSIYAGDRQVIFQLLLQIRKAYGHHHVPHRRPAHSSAA